MNNWKAELDAIVGARHGGAAEAVSKRLVDLDTRHPNVPEINLQLAWSLETEGKGEQALPFYEKALALGLSPNEHAGALIGLGNCFRLAGLYDKAEQTLKSGAVLFTDNREFDAFLALALHSGGKQAEAFKTLMTVLVETSEDYGIRAYQRSLRHEANKLH